MIENNEEINDKGLKGKASQITFDCSSEGNSNCKVEQRISSDINSKNEEKKLKN